MARCANCEEFKGTASEVLEHRRKCKTNEKWREIVAAREASAKRGTAPRKAKRLIRELYGIETKPMPDDVVEKMQESGPVPEVAKRIKALEKAEIKELSKPAYNPKSRMKR